MKILVVDDEIHAFKAIQMQISWDSYGIEEMFYAINGAEGLEVMEQEYPELVFVDMQMPVMDGPAFVRQVRERGFKSQLIAISGYNDFPYFKAVIEARGVDYILKPINVEELNHAICKAIKLIEEEQEKRRLKQFGKEQNEAEIVAWLSGKRRYDKELETRLDMYLLIDERYRLGILLLNNPEQTIAELYDGKNKDLEERLKNMAFGLFGSQEKVYLLAQNPYLHYLIVGEEKISEYEFRNKLHELCRVIQGELMLGVSCDCILYAGTVLELSELAEKVRKSVLTKPIIQKLGKSVIDDDGKPVEQITYQENSLKGLEFLLKEAVRNKDVENISQIIDEFCKSLRKRQQLCLYEIQIHTTEMNLLLKKILMGSSDMGSFRLKTVPIWLYDLEVWGEMVKGAFLEITACHYEQSLNITAVRAYILENYAQNLSIPYLSEYFHQSPQYLSKMYKKKFSETMGETIRRVRMEKAQDYLIHSNLSIGEIAGLVGFEDRNYFGKVFKNFCNVTPQMYRKTGIRDD